MRRASSSVSAGTRAIYRLAHARSSVAGVRWKRRLVSSAATGGAAISGMSSSSDMCCKRRNRLGVPPGGTGLRVPKPSPGELHLSTMPMVAGSSSPPKKRRRASRYKGRRRRIEQRHRGPELQVVRRTEDRMGRSRRSQHRARQLDHVTTVRRRRPFRLARGPCDTPVQEIEEPGPIRLIVRGPSLAASMSNYLRPIPRSRSNAIPRSSLHGTDKVHAVTLRNSREATDCEVTACAVLVMIGAKSNTSRTWSTSTKTVSS
jgi:hypothetical protein